MVVVMPAGVAKVERYLLPSERAVITARQHWFVVAEPVASTVAWLVVAAVADVRLPAGVPLVRDVLWLAWLGLLGRLVWRLLERRADWFVVTDERLLLTHGLLTRRVAVMPLAKVTDMSYNVSPLGRLLHYGEFVFESAGQDQALRNVNFLKDSALLFAVLSEELFGPEGVASTKRRRGRGRPAHDD